MDQTGLSGDAVLQRFHEEPPRTRGRVYEDFEIGARYSHHWGRTVTAADNTLFSTMTLHFNPLYFNDEFAQAHGYRHGVVNPYLLFGIVFGLSVEDLSERGGAFLGVEDLAFVRPFHVGETLLAHSTVRSMRPSSKDTIGIVTWHTVGCDANGETVLSFDRTNMVLRRVA
ncbi:acyl dehydratase [Paraburkholderia sp. BL6669N2]|uniref:MaoC family dehydratase n=1 Tax=Paraburkholderia sp. BL6669N2 TaxID=1938807 RepID=UPI000E2854D4|nr:MaoC family dehydratase [Paraburkholderia sp. BL6669N2]REG50983.1 acyl dehydratase [Paraburkholderia sp. BL6669N2]